MISFLKGNVIQLDEETATVDVNGVGYEVFCSTNTLSSLTNDEATQFYIHTHVREDAFVLYGFGTKTEKELFLSLIKVNGVGPKMAMKILSGTTMDHFLQLIEEGDVKGLSQIPKVGKKTAEQLILALKGKLEFSSEKKSTSRTQGGSTQRQIFSALVNLGFRENDVQLIVQDLPQETTFEEGVRKGLATLSGGQ